MGMLAADEVAFRRWYEASMPRVYAYLLSRTAGDGALAEELTQQVFVDALAALPRYEGSAESVTWLITIAQRRLVDHWRRLGRVQRRHEALSLARRNEDLTAWQATESGSLVRDSLDSLPGDQRIALILFHVDGLPVRAIARLMRRSEGATESLLRRARVGLRREFEGDNHA